MSSKLLALAFGSLAVSGLLSGCASVTMVRWNGNQFTLCGNRFAAPHDYEDAARERCRGPATAIGGGLEPNGVAVVHQYYGWYGGGTQVVSQGYSNCTTYVCGTEAPPPPPVGGPPPGYPPNGAPPPGAGYPPPPPGTPPPPPPGVTR